MLKKIPLLALIIFLFGCHDFDPMEDVMITINYDLFETFVSFRFVDAETGDLIGAKDMSAVTASFKGDDAAAVGEKDAVADGNRTGNFRQSVGIGFPEQ